MYEQIIFNAAYEKLVGAGFVNARALASLMVAQAKHETGNFTSRHFRESKNAFGYSYVKGAKYQIGAGSIADNGLKVAKYASVADSAKDVAGWISRRKKYFSDVNTAYLYAQRLKQQGYYGDTLTNYLAGLKRFYKDMAPNMSVLLLLAGALLIYTLTA